MALATRLGAVELKVDHVTVAGRNLAGMQRAFEAVGIASEFGGKHTNGMTEMAIAGFPDGSYLEFIAGEPGARVANHYWGPFMERDAGVCAWAVGVADIQAEAKRLKSAGIEISPSSSGRQRPDGESLRWTSASVGPPPQGSFFPFLIQDLTPRDLRVYPHGKPSTPNIDGIALVVIAVRNLGAAIQNWRTTFGLAEPQLQDDGHLKARLAAFSGTPVILASGPWVSQRLEEFGEAPFAAILRAKQLPAAAAKAQSKWFGHSIGWFDPTMLKGARIGVMVDAPPTSSTSPHR